MDPNEKDIAEKLARDLLEGEITHEDFMNIFWGFHRDGTVTAITMLALPLADGTLLRTWGNEFVQTLRTIAALHPAAGFMVWQADRYVASQSKPLPKEPDPSKTVRELLEENKESQNN